MLLPPPPQQRRLARLAAQLQHSAQIVPPPTTVSSGSRGSTTSATASPPAAGSRRPRVACIVTTCFPRSHGDVILTKLLKGMSLDSGFASPRVEIVSIWIDCIAATSPDVIVPLAKQLGVTLYPSIRRALLHGSEELNVDAVLVVGEHGDYPNSETGREMHPRRYFTEQILGTFAESGRSVPIFNDKHLAYSWADASWMWDRAATLGAPLMAGSSVPLAWRDPWLEHPKGTKLQSALAIGFSAVESYGFHATEVLQSMVERREGGESGVVAVQCLEGAAIWVARDAGLWDGALAEAALAAITAKPRANVKQDRLESLERMEQESMEGTTVESIGPAPGHALNTALFVVEYADGFRGFVLMLPGFAVDFAYAARLSDGEVVATVCSMQAGGTISHFSYLCRNIERFFIDGVAPYPVERTLLTTGVIDEVMASRVEGGKRRLTPHLCTDTFVYESWDESPERPSGREPSGACLDPDAPDEAWSEGGSRFRSQEWADRVLPRENPDAPTSSF
jgi:hypothetical protein